jgi:hypothetical protein
MEQEPVATSPLAAGSLVPGLRFGRGGLEGYPQTGQWPVPSRFFSSTATTAWVFHR